MSKYVYHSCIVTTKTFEGLVEVDGVLARVGGRRRQGEAGHRRRSVRVRARSLPAIRFDLAGSGMVISDLGNA